MSRKNFSLCVPPYQRHSKVENSGCWTGRNAASFIAETGIVVRNSIILVDFIELRLAEGAPHTPLGQAVIYAGAVRFRLVMLTAAAW